MSSLTAQSRQFIEDYLHALSGQPKTDELVGRFVSDPALVEHIRGVEAAFPAYELIAHQLIAEEDLIEMRGTFHGVHRGPFAGIEPTGKAVSANLMIFLPSGRRAHRRALVADGHGFPRGSVDSPRGLASGCGPSKAG